MLLRPMEDSECWSLLESQRLCVLSVVDGDEPYAVPVFYGLAGHSVILGLSEGRKTRALESNSRVCITVTEIRDNGFWQSAQITGLAVVLEDEQERQDAIRMLTAHNRRLNPAATGGAPPRVAPGKIVRIEPKTVSGRAKQTDGDRA